MRSSLQDYSEQEFLELLLKSEAEDFEPDKLDELVAFFNTKILHPSGSDIIMTLLCQVQLNCDKSDTIMGYNSLAI